MRLHSHRPHALGLALSLAVAAPLSAQIDASFEQRLQHWAWRPLADAPIPTVRLAARSSDAIDAFLLAPLEQNGIERAEAAPPHVWLRRVCFDLTGLPPDERLVASFALDNSPTARERVVDALLASKSHAERWARHWLDLVRYAETLGHEFDFRIPEAWRYRDYVVRAIDADVPFDVFAKEHIAGDLLPNPRIDPNSGTNESSIATGFYWFCEQTHSPIDAKQHEADRIDNQIDVLTKTFLGVTVACARCHDHKFDAIGDEDYYALYGFLKSSRYAQRPIRRAEPSAVEAAAAAQAALASIGAPARDDAQQHKAPLHESVRGWAAVGDQSAPQPLDSGFVDSVTADAVRVRAFDGTWLTTAAISRERDCVLMSPTMELDGSYLHVEVAGHGARAQLIVDGFHIVRDPIYGRLRHGIGNQEPHWIRFDLGQFRGHRGYLQLLDQRAHDLADPERDGGAYPDDAWVAVRSVVISNDKEPPFPAAKGSLRELPLTDTSVAAALQRWRASLAALPKPGTAPGMADGTGEDEHVFLRGSHKDQGPIAPRRFLRAIAGEQPMELPRGSGRLELAERMFGPDNPLPARVLANRLWHHMFGRGLARTVDNLGHLGEAPTHPELLDHLALSLVRSGWSQKKLLRRIALSQAYAMDSVASDAQIERDPNNQQWSRQNLRRLQGEAVRDAILAIADRLDERRFGPSVPVRLHPHERARGKPDRQGPVDGDGRRSIYLAAPRNFLPDFLVAFDLPRPFSTMGARTTGNVPAQSLAMQNDAFVLAMARVTADHLMQDEKLATDEDRVRRWFVRMFARPPSSAESAACIAMLQAARTDLAADANDARPFAELAHALWNKKEFVYLR